MGGYSRPTAFGREFGLALQTRIRYRRALNTCERGRRRKVHAARVPSSGAKAPETSCWLRRCSTRRRLAMFGSGKFHWAGRPPTRRARLRSLVSRKPRGVPHDASQMSKLTEGSGSASASARTLDETQPREEDARKQPLGRSICTSDNNTQCRRGQCRKATIDTMSLGLYGVSTALKEIAKAIRFFEKKLVCA